MESRVENGKGGRNNEENVSVFQGLHSHKGTV